MQEILYCFAGSSEGRRNLRNRSFWAVGVFSFLPVAHQHSCIKPLFLSLGPGYRHILIYILRCLSHSWSSLMLAPNCTGSALNLRFMLGLHIASISDTGASKLDAFSSSILDTVFCPTIIRNNSMRGICSWKYMQRCQLLWNFPEGEDVSWSCGCDERTWRVETHTGIFEAAWLTTPPRAAGSQLQLLQKASFHQPN